MNRDDLDNANNTTQLPEAELRNGFIMAQNHADKKLTSEQCLTSDQQAPKSLGTFSGGAGTSTLSRSFTAGSWVIFTVRTSDLASAAAELLRAWKIAEPVVTVGNAEFKIISFKNTDWIHGVLEIGEIFGGDIQAPLKMASEAMQKMAQHMINSGYEISRD